MKTTITCSECGMTYDSDNEYHYGYCGQQKSKEKIAGVVYPEESESVILDEPDLLQSQQRCKPGSKYDNGKLRYDLFPPKCLEAIVDILTYGVQKYDDYNWVEVPEANKRYYAALMRHLEAWRKGEQLDSESGRLHLAHAATCMIFLLWFDLHKDGISKKKIIERITQAHMEKKNEKN